MEKPQWYRVPGDDSQVALCQYGRQLGNYSFADGFYRELRRDGTWGPKTIPPVEPPPPPEKYRQKTAHRIAARDNYGIDLTHLASEPTYAINGRRVPAREAFQAIAAGGSLSDDTHKPRLTVIGSDAQCRAVLDNLGSLKDGLLVQCYPPGHWATAVFNLDKLEKQPDLAVFLETPPNAQGRAKVLYCQLGDADPERLREAVRQADPNYRPQPTPKPEPEPRPAGKPLLESVPAGVWMLLVALVLVLTRRK